MAGEDRKKGGRDDALVAHLDDLIEHHRVAIGELVDKARRDSDDKQAGAAVSARLLSESMRYLIEARRVSKRKRVRLGS